MDNSLFKEQLDAALNKAYFYLKFRPRTVKEVADYLNKKAQKRHWPVEVVEEAIKLLKEQDYLDDRAFVRWFVEQRSAGKPKSTFALKGELARLGIAKDITEEFFTEEPLAEESLAVKALRSKWGRFARLDKRERFQKAVAFLARRGFSFGDAKNALKVLEDNE